MPLQVLDLSSTLKLKFKDGKNKRRLARLLLRPHLRIVCLGIEPRPWLQVGRPHDPKPASGLGAGILGLSMRCTPSRLLEGVLLWAARRGMMAAR
jgi:hypothetical protein